MAGFRTRIAPTPSGYLHAGNALDFLLAHALARESGGTVLLRIDDLDAERARPAYVQDIFDSLHWLGIAWDEGPRDPGDFHASWSQADRLEPAHEMLWQLREMGALFACTCSRKQLTDCACRDAGLPFDVADTAWRLRVPRPCPVSIKGLFSGTVAVDLGNEMPDPVLRQRNGLPAYQVASLADDVHFGIDTIVRGADLLPSTACQLHIAGLLGASGFLNARFLHHPLLKDEAGQKLSKSAGAGSLKAMRERGAATDGLRRAADEMLARLQAQGL